MTLTVTTQYGTTASTSFVVTVLVCTLELVDSDGVFPSNTPAATCEVYDPPCEIYWDDSTLVSESSPGNCGTISYNLDNGYNANIMPGGICF